MFFSVILSHGVSYKWIRSAAVSYSGLMTGNIFGYVHIFYRQKGQAMENRKNLYMVVADNIRRERRRLRLTQMELADRADISVDTVKSIERGRRSMSLDTYLGIVQALETSPSALVNGKEPGKYMERFRYIIDQRSDSEIEFVLHMLEQC